MSDVEAQMITQTSPQNAVERNNSVLEGHHPQHAHICTRCSAELREPTFTDVEASRWTPRHKLIYLAIIISILIFIFEVVEMLVTPGNPGWTHLGVPLIAALLCDVTYAVLFFLLKFGRRRGSNRWLARTTTQIGVFSALGLAWEMMAVAMLVLNKEACGQDPWRRYSKNKEAACGLYTTSHVFAWILCIILYTAAWMVYSRAVSLHGKAKVPRPGPPPVIAAWRLTDVADGEGSIKL
ncbi:hypothetical protein C8J57DRAFT_1276941 [Mycena rebaudengoi]|nr:hypothetical protein C8J57DRAFT_1276941 [Mycena rebaudengoi]